MNEWQPIETAPDDGTWVLAYGKGPGFERCNFIAYSDGDQWFNVYEVDMGPSHPTHWMPLPEPPQ